MAEQLFTFGVFNADQVRAIEAGDLSEAEATYDEIDVRASTRHEAEQLARAEADRDYGEGSRLFPLQPGGSGGLVWTWTVDLDPEARPLEPSEPLPAPDPRYIP